MPPILRAKLLTAGILMLAATLLGTAGYYFLGILTAHQPPWPVLDCFYMTIITLTTVGFGEVIDVGNVPGARLFTVVILVSGLGIAAYFLSTLTAFLVEGELRNVFWRKRMEKEVRKLKGHIIVCGAGRVGYYIVEELIRTKTNMVLVERDEKRIRYLQEAFGFFPALVGDATHDLVLRSAAVDLAHGLITTLRDDKDNLCVVVTCRQLHPGLHVITRCTDSQFASKLEMVGADVVVPNLIGGLRIASMMIRPRVVRYLDTMLRDRDYVVRIEDVTLPEHSGLVGRPVGEADFGDFGNILLLAVIASGSQHPIYNPPPSQILKAGDTLVLQAELSALRRFEEKFA